MKRIILVLVLLVTWSFTSVPSLTTPAQAGEIQTPDNHHPGSNGFDTLETTGEPRGDSEGDPGDLGDGYGAVGDPRSYLDSLSSDSSELSALEEYYLLLMLMVQQLAP